MKKFIMKSFLMILSLFLLLTMAGFFYVIFYNVVIPDISVTGSLDFVFDNCKSEKCSHPVAEADFSKPNFAYTFKRGEIYDLYLDFMLPESQSNYDVGMFVVRVEYLTEMKNTYPYIIPLHFSMEIDGKKAFIFKQTRKSTMLRYKSPLLRSLYSIAFSPFLVYGLLEESQRISIKASEFAETMDNPVLSLNVIFESLNLDIYEAHLTVVARIEGFRYYMYHFPLTSFILGSAFFLIPVAAVFFSVSSNSLEMKKIASNIIRRGREATESNKPEDTADENVENIEEISIVHLPPRPSVSSFAEAERTVGTNETRDESPHSATPPSEVASGDSEEPVATDDEGSIEVLASSDCSYDMCEERSQSSLLDSSLHLSSLQTKPFATSEVAFVRQRRVGDSKSGAPILRKGCSQETSLPEEVSEESK